MRTIWKFLIPVADDVTIDMPVCAEVLHVAAADVSTLAVWASVSTVVSTEPRTFHVRGTGHPLGAVGPYLGTAQAGPFVWHLFDDKRIEG